MAVAPSGAYAYVVNNTANIVSQYAIQPDGTFIGVGSPVAAGVGSRSMAIERGGKFAYVASDDGTVSQYAVGTDGKLTPLGPAASAFGYAYAIAVLVR